MLAILACTIAMICLIFMDPTLAIRLSDLGVSSAMVGMAFAVMGFCFAIGSPIAGSLCNLFGRKSVMQLGLWLLSVSSLLIGPS